MEVVVDEQGTSRPLLPPHLLPKLITSLHGRLLICSHPHLGM